MKTKTIYTATFSDGRTAARATSTAAGYPVAALVETADGGWRTIFGGSRPKIMNSFNADLNAAREIVAYNQDNPEIVKMGEMSLTSRIVEIVETTT